MSVFISLFTIALNAILAENFILVKFMGICPFMGVSKKQDTALGMGIAVTFVMGIASAATWAVNEFLLVPLNLAADDGGIGAGAEHIALPGDVAFFHQVGDMDCDRGAGDARAFRKGFLRDHGVGLDPLQDLAFTLCHGRAS